MITGVELDFVVKDCLTALPLYQSIFDVLPIDVTDLEKGQNEAIFSIYDTRFHMLDENPDFQLLAPQEGGVQSFWFNVMVPDIDAVFKRAMEAGCTEIQPVTAMPSLGLSNGMFLDPFGYIWMLHQIHSEESFSDHMQNHIEEDGI